MRGHISNTKAKELLRLYFLFQTWSENMPEEKLNYDVKLRQTLYTGVFGRKIAACHIGLVKQEKISKCSL